jgi:hypothetical protein
MRCARAPPHVALSTFAYSFLLGLLHGGLVGVVVEEPLAEEAHSVEACRLLLAQLRELQRGARESKRERQ